MGKPKYIYFTDELHKKLSKEENASALICGLLNNYYANTKEEKMSLAEKDIKLAQDIEEKKKELELMEEEHNNLLRDQEKESMAILEEAKIEKEKKEIEKEWAEKMKKIPQDKRIKWSEYYESKRKK